jgi:hypothetical protein
MGVQRTRASRENVRRPTARFLLSVPADSALCRPEGQSSKEFHEVETASALRETERRQ